MYSGLLSSQILDIPYPPFSCPSGNCTWDPFLTVGVEALCLNNTNQVMLNCTEGVGNATLCSLAAHDSPVFKPILASSNWVTPMVMISSMSRDMQVDPTMFAPFANITGLLGTLSWAKIIGGILPFGGAQHWLYPNSTFEAFTCGVYTTVLEIQPTVTSGLYQEEILRSIGRIQNNSETPSGTWGGIDFYYHDPWDVHDIVYKLDSGNSTNETELRISSNSFQILASQFILPSFLQGNVSFGSSAGYKGSTDLALMLFLADNTTRAILNMATYMTNALRANDTTILQNAHNNASLIAPTHMAYGQTLVDIPYVTIRWPWLSLPATMLALTCIFLAMTIRKTRDGPAGLWKASPLALLFHTAIGESFSTILSGLQRGDEYLLDTVDEIEKVASKFNARVYRDSSGFPLINLFIREGTGSQAFAVKPSMKRIEKIPRDSLEMDE